MARVSTLLFAMLSSACSRAAPVADSPRVEVVTATDAANASNRFGFDVFSELGIPSENQVFSPVSASLALAMAAAGAKGETLAQMERVLRVNSLPSAHRGFAGLVASFPNNPEPDARESERAPDSETVDPDLPSAFRPPTRPSLLLADRAFAQRGFTYRSDFLSVLSDVYRAPLELVDYRKDSEGARATINTWTEKQTRGRIKDLLPNDAVGELTRLVLVNALYFKAAWLVPFEVATTHDEDFATPDRPVRTKMMRQVSRFAYHHGDGAALVELPYRDSSISMVVFLPDDPSGLTELEHHIARDYARWVTAASPTRVDLWLPRWKATATHDLRTPLKHLGMELPFSCRADFSGMTDEVTDDVCPVGAAGPTRPATLHIDDVVQKAFVDVDEQGTEAAAATAVAMTLALSAHDTREEKPVIFHADHPFHYVIRDRRTGVILFVGRVTQPELAR